MRAQDNVDTLAKLTGRSLPEIVDVVLNGLHEPVKLVRLAEVVEELAEIEWPTNCFTPPTSASPAWKELYRELGQLDASLKEHMLVEDRLLFSRAIGG